jgi:hypothetical protein
VDYWEEKMLDKCSSPSKPAWEEFCDGTKTTLASAQLNQYLLKILAEKHQEDVKRKVMGRKVVANFGPWADYDSQKKFSKIELDIQEALIKNRRGHETKLGTLREMKCRNKVLLPGNKRLQGSE